MGQMIMLGLIFVIFYMLLIRPQNQRMKKHREMLAEIQRGDVVVTNGGLEGKVTKVTDDRLIIDLGEGVKLEDQFVITEAGAELMSSSPHHFN